MNKVQTFFASCFVGISIWFTGFALWEYSSLPIVYESYNSGQCLKVDDLANHYSCDNLPERYIHRWEE